MRISELQVLVLLDKEQKWFYKKVLAENVYCSKCDGVAMLGIEVEEIYLDSLNDIRVAGVCNACKSKVSRTFEFGENKEFFERAVNLRKSLMAKL